MADPIDSFPAKLKILALYDGKAGHDSQTFGLCNALQRLRNCHVEEMSVRQARSTCLSSPLLSSNTSLSKNKSSINRTKAYRPDIVIGAGHRTHKTLLRYKLLHGAFTCVLMKPSLPKSLFNAVICPQHDDILAGKNVFKTLGTINKVTPLTNQDHERDKHLILLGGPSKLYQWNDDEITHQIKTIAETEVVKEWFVCPSRRTPESTLTQIQKAQLNNINLVMADDHSNGTLSELMLSSRFTWVSPDSQSMIYESLTAGSPTNLLQLSNENTAKSLRVQKTLDELIDRNVISGFEQWAVAQKAQETLYYPPAPKALREADKAAEWLLNIFEKKRKK